MNTHTHQQLHPAVADQDLRSLEPLALRTLTVQQLAELRALWPYLTDLVDTHQRGLGFLTPTGRVVLDEQVRKDREARLPNLKAGVKITGDVPAPGNITVYSLAAEVPVLLLDEAWWLIRRARRAGAPLPVAPFEQTTLRQAPTLGEIITHLETVLAVTEQKPLLLSACRAVTDITDRVRRLVHGNDRTSHPKPCPHCRRHTLVVYLDAGVIRCERDPHTGEYEPCVCDDSYCDCKIRHHRHEWHRDKGSQKWGWYGLKNDQTRAERTTTTSQEPPT